MGNMSVYNFLRIPFQVVAFTSKDEKTNRWFRVDTVANSVPMKYIGGYEFPTAANDNFEPKRTA